MFFTRFYPATTTIRYSDFVVAAINFHFTQHTENELKSSNFLNTLDCGRIFDRLLYNPNERLDKAFKIRSQSEDSAAGSKNKDYVLVRQSSYIDYIFNETYPLSWITEPFTIEELKAWFMDLNEAYFQFMTEVSTSETIQNIFKDYPTYVRVILQKLVENFITNFSMAHTPTNSAKVNAAYQSGRLDMPFIQSLLTALSAILSDRYNDPNKKTLDLIRLGQLSCQDIIYANHFAFKQVIILLTEPAISNREKAIKQKFFERFIRGQYQENDSSTKVSEGLKSIISNIKAEDSSAKQSAQTFIVNQPYELHSINILNMFWAFISSTTGETSLASVPQRLCERYRHFIGFTEALQEHAMSSTNRTLEERCSDSPQKPPASEPELQTLASNCLAAEMRLLQFLHAYPVDLPADNQMHVCLLCQFNGDAFKTALKDHVVRHATQNAIKDAHLPAIFTTLSLRYQAPLDHTQAQHADVENNSVITTNLLDATIDPTLENLAALITRHYPNPKRNRNIGAVLLILTADLRALCPHRDQEIAFRCQLVGLLIQCRLDNPGTYNQRNISLIFHSEPEVRIGVYHCLSNLKSAYCISPENFQGFLRQIINGIQDVIQNSSIGAIAPIGK